MWAGRSAACALLDVNVFTLPHAVEVHPAMLGFWKRCADLDNHRICTSATLCVDRIGE